MRASPSTLIGERGLGGEGRALKSPTHRRMLWVRQLNMEVDMRAKQWAVVVFTGVLMTSTAAFGQATWPDLSEPAGEQGGGDKDAVLIVGVEDYVFAPDIKGAIGNANDWYTYFTRTRKVPVGNVFLLRDNEGTRETMLEKATEVVVRQPDYLKTMDSLVAATPASTVSSRRAGAVVVRVMPGVHVMVGA